MLMKRSTRSVLIIGIIISASLWSCQWHTIEPLAVDVDLSVEVSFSQDVYPIFTGNSCDGCHPALQNPPDFSSVANGYTSLIDGNLVDTGTPENSVILTEIEGGHKGSSYTNEEQSTILTWITQGALNN